MYRQHWGLREVPFRSSLEPGHFYQSPTHEESLARLHFLVEHRRRMGLLLGAPGSGKSMLLEVFANELRRGGRQVALVNLLGLDVAEFVWTLAVGLGLNPPAGEPLWCYWRAVTDRLIEHRYQQIDTIVLLDDVHEAAHDILTQIARLVQNDLASGGRLTVVLGTDSGRYELLGRRLLELCELRIDLEPWEEEDTEEYVRQRLAQAGRQESPFAASALSRLHQLSGGLPRRVCQLAQLSLLAGAGQQLHVIDEGTVEAVSEELGVMDAPSLP